ncbi:MAG: hypothetical protein ACREMB_09645, partial [Candidatus Rokuibacteriota bacterium]
PVIVDAPCHVFEYGKGWSARIARIYLEAGLARVPVRWDPTRTWRAEDQHVDVDRLVGHTDAAGVATSIVFGVTARPYDCVTRGTPRVSTPCPRNHRQCRAGSEPSQNPACRLPLAFTVAAPRRPAGAGR